MERSTILGDNTKTAILRVATQFLPDLDLENDAIGIRVSPMAVAVVRQRRLAPGNRCMDEHINFHAKENRLNVNMDPRADVVSWYIHGMEARHVILVLGAESATFSFLSPALVLPELLSYTRRDSGRWNSYHGEINLVELVMGMAQDKSTGIEHFEKWLKILGQVERDRQMVLTYDPLAEHRRETPGNPISFLPLNPR